MALERTVTIDRLLGSRRFQCLTVLLVLLVLLACGLASATTARAANPSLFTTFPEGGFLGSGSSKQPAATAITTDPDNGHVYVADRANRRIDEFTAWGELVKAWGWGIVASGPDHNPNDEVQEVAVAPGVTGGSFELEYLSLDYVPPGIAADQKTAPIAFDATAAAVEDALAGLTNLQAGAASVTGPAGGPWTVDFAGPLADTDVAELSVVESTLTGGEAKVRTVQQGAAFEVCEPSKGDVCRKGQAASELPGQILQPKGLAVDPVGGGLYVYEGETSFLKYLRVQRFDPATGAFELEIGGEVDRTTGANLCTSADVALGDVCRGGKTGTADGRFSNRIFGNEGFGGNITTDAAGDLYVGDSDRIEKFDPSGAFLASLPLPEPGDVKSLAFDRADNTLLVDYFQGAGNAQQNVRRLNPETGAEVGQIVVERPQALAAPDAAGIFYMVAQFRNYENAEGTEEVIAFDASGEPVIPLLDGFDRKAKHEQNFASAVGEYRPGIALDTACGTTGIYVLNMDEQAVDAYGPTPDPALCPPPLVPPTIKEQYAVSVRAGQATVRASINPHFWADTRYYVEYGTSPCGGGGCSTEPAPPGQLLTESPIGGAVETGKVTLSGLEPDTTYYFRFVAKSGGGGPVEGVGAGEAEGRFTTRGLVGPPDTACPNQEFRLGAAARLPDCRAYEMVSPVDKGSGNAIGREGGAGIAALDQSAEGGERFSFTSYRSFGDAQASTYGNQYMATRGGEGWTTTAITPPNGPSFVSSLRTLTNEYMAFSSDLCAGWLLRISDPPLADDAPEGFANLYRRSNCGENPLFSALVNVPVEAAPVTENESLFYPELQGLSTDGQVAVFSAEGKLTADAPAIAELQQVYENVNGALQLVSILPNGEASTIASSVGTFERVFGFGKLNAVDHAVSADGSRIYWSQLTHGPGSGKIYVRVDGTTTLPVSELASVEPARFLFASVDGAVAYFTVGEDLYRYGLASESVSLVAEQVRGALGASDDGSRIYFVSRQALAAGGITGNENIYYDDGGAMRFVAAVSPLDTAQFTPSSVNNQPLKHLARVTPDGEHLVFMATSKPLSEATAGYDNTDAVSGEPDAEVYVYDGSGNKLHCVSCDPSGARPNGRLIAPGQQTANVWAAAEIPGGPTQLYASRVLAADGSRLFFQTTVPLADDDENEALDVYEWETPGTGDCTTASAEYRSAAGGCVELISAGTGNEPSEFVDASRDGSNAFFLTESSLVAGDPGQIDVYDARIGGGFAEPSSPPDCSGEACQPPPAPPGQAVPATPGFHGPGNLKRPKPRPHCGKGRHKVTRKGKTRCVKKGRKQRKSSTAHHHGRHRHSSAGRRQGRGHKSAGGTGR